MGFKQRPPQTKPLQKKGKLGEQWAAQYLQGLGHLVLHTNWRAGRVAEIDIISWNPFTKTYHFTEVKTRKTALSRDATEQATLKKLTKLQLGMQHYLVEKHLPEASTLVQLDWLVVLLPKANQNKLPELLYYPNITQ